MNIRMIWGLLAGVGLAFADSDSSRSFPVQLGGCTEYVGTGPIAIAQAARFVPAPLAVLNDGSGNATLVVRASRCSTVTVDGAGRGEPGVVSHIGISIVSPDGTGAINNYTIAYATDSARLAQRLERAGLPVLLDTDLVYEVTPAAPVTSSELYVEVSPDRGAGWSITGSVTNNAFLTIPFVANWWYKSREGLVKMATDIPSITFKAAQATVITRSTTALGRLLLGANSFSQFGARPADFNVRGEFGAALVSVSVR